MTTEQTSREAVRRRLQQAFSRSGLTQDELAKRCGASKAAVSDWFNPKKDAVPDGEKMARLPSALDVSGHWLLTGEGASVPGGDASIKRAERAGAQSALTEIGRAVEQLRATYSSDRADDAQQAATARQFVREQAGRAARRSEGKSRRRAS